MEESNFLMRSLMFVPAHNERLMNSAIRSDADVLLLDIEDSVQPFENKQVARNNILRYVSEGKFDGRILFPRINDRESGELLRDVYQLTVEGITGFMYPKAKTGRDVYFIGKLLETIEYEKVFCIAICGPGCRVLDFILQFSQHGGKQRRRRMERDSGLEQR